MKPILLVRNRHMSKYERTFAERYFEVCESRMDCGGRLVIGRYSVTPCYDELDRDLNLVGARLVNTFEQHRWIASFDYYDAVRNYTPETWTDETFVYCRYEGPFVVKGKLRSKKVDWATRMFAPTKEAALRLAALLKEDSEIAEQGVVYRRYVPLRTFEVGRNGLPYANEWRFFYFGRTLLSHAFYWSISDAAHEAKLDEAGLQMADEIAGIVARHAAFFTLDLAETADGRWILIEINDGQTSGPSEHDLDVLYRRLRDAADDFHLIDAPASLEE